MHRTTHPGIVAVAIAVAATGLAIAAQTGSDQTLTLDNSFGLLTGVLRLPSAVRPPVVLLVASAETGNLAAGLASENVASVRISARSGDEATIARWIVMLRNDERFPTVSVMGEGAALESAMIAARAARADGVILREEPGSASDEIARLIAAKLTIGTPSSSDAHRIAAFARGVPALGRRGTSPVRPSAARRSPRQMLLTTIGAVRVGVEWGQPQKRGREIWGTLVRWNEIWMPGADEATTITTNGALRFGPLEIPAGDHTLYLFPTPERVQLVVSNDVGQFHTVHDATRELGRIDMIPGSRADAVEGLTFAVESQPSGGVFRMAWDTREFAVPIRVPAPVSRGGATGAALSSGAAAKKVPVRGTPSGPPGCRRPVP